MMSSYELTLPPVRLSRNPVTGRFMKGHVPANKGKKYEEYMTADKAEAIKKSKSVRPGPGSWQSRMRKVVALWPDGRFMVFASVALASSVMDIDASHISRACRNHHLKAGGLQWYYESEDEWLLKVKII